MMTIVTVVTLKHGAEPEWDAAIRERFEAAQGQRGWVGGQLLMPLDGGNRRVIVGTWQTRADWETWHRDEAFVASRSQLEGLESGPRDESWHEVLLSADGAAHEEVMP